MRARLRYGAAAACGVLLSAGLVACGGDEAPEGSPPPGASTSASAPATPELPDAARGTGPKAAEAFVRHYVDLINHATSTLETAPLERASANDCTGCRSVADLYAGVRSNGGAVRGGEWTIENVELNGRRAYVRVSYPRQVVRYEDGEPAKTFPPGEALFRFQHSRRGQQFVMTDMQGPVE